MKILNKKMGVAFLTMVIISLTLSSCYKNFDPKSYAPAFTINGFSSVSSIEPTSLVAYWAFDGSLIDSVSKANANNSGTSFANGFKGKGLSLDATSKSYVTFNPSASLTGLQSFTISYWVNPTFVDGGGNSIAGILGLVNFSNTTGFWGNVDWFVENGSNKDAATLKAHITSKNGDTWVVVGNIQNFFGSWTSHTLTYDAATNTATYYINGSSVGTSSASWGGPITFTDPGPLVFGCVQFQTNPSLTSATGSQGWASYLTGTMDEIRIYNKALTASQINSMVVLQAKGK